MAVWWVWFSLPEYIAKAWHNRKNKRLPKVSSACLLMLQYDFCEWYNHSWYLFCSSGKHARIFHPKSYIHTCISHNYKYAHSNWTYSTWSQCKYQLLHQPAPPRGGEFWFPVPPVPRSEMGNFVELLLRSLLVYVFFMGLHMGIIPTKTLASLLKNIYLILYILNCWSVLS